MTSEIARLLEIYAVGSVTVAVVAFLLLPGAVRWMLGRTIAATSESLEQEAKRRQAALLQRGREAVLTGPQGAVIGHLIEPYLERFADWISQTLRSSVESGAYQPFVDACLKQVVAKRLFIAVTISQAI